MTSPLPYMILYKQLGRELRRRVGWLLYYWLDIVLWWRGLTIKEKEREDGKTNKN